MSTTKSTATPAHPVHGTKGAYVGGKWCDMSDIEDLYLIKDGSHVKNSSNNNCMNKGQCSTCPRSKSRNTSLKKNQDYYDIVIIGAGCIGSAIARELSKYQDLSILLLEGADDVTQGATKGNSGIVHAGFDDKPGSVRAKFCWPGNQMFPDLDKDLHFGYDLNGSLVVARSKDDEETLRELMERGRINGVKNLQILNQQELREREPYIHPDATSALFSPDAGTVIPYEYAIAMAENAVDNGVELRIRREVIDIQKNNDNNNGLFEITVNHWETKKYVDLVMSQRGTSLAKICFSMSIMLIAIAIGFVLQNNDDNNNMNDIFNVKIFENVDDLSSTQMIVLPLCALSALLAVISISGGGLNINSGVKLDAPNTIPVVGKSKTPRVSVDSMRIGGSGSQEAVQGVSVDIETIKAKYIVNCAGCASDKIAKMIGDDSFTIKPRLGEYILLNKNQGHLTKATLFPAPGKMGKGVLVQQTLWGNLILGPTARDIHDPLTAKESMENIMSYILSKCRQLVPDFDAREVIHAFSGARAKSTRGDWIIEPSVKDSNFIHAAGIDSPGLAGSPAIAIEVVRLLQNAGVICNKKKDFNPKRAPIVRPKEGWKGIQAGPKGKVKDPVKNVVCKCEKVTEAEVVEALRRSLPIDSTQAIRKRTRAGMGHCQGDPDNYDCECRVAEIIARENKIPVDAVGRRPWPATSTLPQRWINDKEKNDIQELSVAA